MKEKTGTVFSIAQDNIPVPGCTVSKDVYRGRNAVTYFSMAEGTDISAEFYPYYKLLLPAAGSIELYGDVGFHSMANSGDGILIPPDTMMGIRTESGAVYTEVLIQKEDAVNKVIQENEAFRLADLIPYKQPYQSR